MIITRSPLRISLGGGGTDLPSYYREHGGFVVAAAINRYVYITVHEAFQPRILLKYSKLEDVERVEEIEHPIIREALKLTEVTGPYLPGDGSVDVVSRTGYRRRLPLRDASSLLLATSAAGQPLSDGHGAPVRLVAPGRRGFWWVKWVERIEVVDAPWWRQPPFPLQ